MAATGTVTAQAILKAYFNNVAPSLTNHVFVDLTTTVGTGTTPGTTLAYTGYARVDMGASTSNWAVGGSNPNNVVTNALPITWVNQVPGSVTTPLDKVVQVVLYGSASPGTDVLFILDIPTQYQKAFTAGDQPTLPAQALVLTLN